MTLEPTLAPAIACGPGDDVGQLRSGRTSTSDRRSTVSTLLLLVPVLVIAWMGWRHRWTADDGFINFRIVRNIREGHGPVYNIGDRVESGTSSLWIVVLAVGDLLTPIRLEWIALLGGLAGTLGGVTLAILATRRVLLRQEAAVGVLLPLGALMYVALPPAWDFATSGLESGLGILWLGACWWLLADRIGRADLTSPARPWWVPVVLGLGPLVRPDFAIFSAAFLVALVLVGRWRWSSSLLALALAIALPFADELFRMAYYGSAIPNTAIVKEASLTRWSQGWLYVKDFFGSYRLLLPVVVVVCVFLCRLLSRRGAQQRQLRVVTGLTVAAGIAHGVYVTRLGGDFMHGRMLLPSLFAVLLPVSVVAVRSWEWFVAAALVVWALVCGTTLRAPYSGPHPLHPDFAYGAVNMKTGVGDERLFYLRLSQVSHPVTFEDYLEHSSWAKAGDTTRRIAASGQSGLLLNAIDDQHSLIPLRQDVAPRVVAVSDVLGIFGYGAGDRVYVVDTFGLADVVPAHVRLAVRGRPGHEKFVSPAWVVARFARLDRLYGVSAKDVRDVAAAQRALECGELAELQHATTARLDFPRAMTNLRQAIGLASFRYSPDPVKAEHELCGTG